MRTSTQNATTKGELQREVNNHPTTGGVDLRDMPLAVEFLKEEQKQRRAEIENILKRVEDDQRYALLITGVFWSWYATNLRQFHPSILHLLQFTPALLTFFFAWRWWNLSRSVVRTTEYTIELERTFLSGLPDHFGWESWLLKQRGSQPLKASLKGVHYIFWIGLLLTNAVIGVWILILGR